MSSVGAQLGREWTEWDCLGHEPCAFWRDVDIFVLHLPHPKYDNMGAMAVTLAQTLGQNLGMMWNKHRSSAGISEDPIWPHNQLRPTPSSSGSEEGVCGRGVVLYAPLYPPGSPLRGLQVSGQLAGLHHGGYWVSSWGQIRGGFWARRVPVKALRWQYRTSGLKRSSSQDYSGFQEAQFSAGHCTRGPRVPCRTPKLTRL